MMIAEARVRRIAVAYRGFAKNVTSPSPACSRLATRRISSVPSPSRRHPMRSASSVSCMERQRISRGLDRGSLEEFREMRKVERRRNLVYFAVAFVWFQRENTAQTRELRARTALPSNLGESVLGAAARQVMADEPE